jgi:hypothetical protein
MQTSPHATYTLYKIACRLAAEGSLGRLELELFVIFGTVNMWLL